MEVLIVRTCTRFQSRLCSLKYLCMCPTHVCVTGVQTCLMWCVCLHVGDVKETHVHYVCWLCLVAHTMVVCDFDTAAARSLILFYSVQLFTPPRSLVWFYSVQLFTPPRSLVLLSTATTSL